MAVYDLPRDPVWLAEIREGVAIWQHCVDNFLNSGVQAIWELLTYDRGYTCYAWPSDGHWLVQVVGDVHADRPVQDWVSVYTAGRSLLAALAVAAGALEAIRCEDVTFALSVECQGVVACTG